MGFFDKIFKKKQCDICGGEIGLLGNRKLEDGNMCKACASKLSSWFDERRHSTIEQIKEQLEYRESNKEKVAVFRTTRTLGEWTKVLVDGDAGVFVVTSAKNLNEANPDVVALSDITGCNLDIRESRTELKKDGENGEKVSYNPPRYTYRYDFYIKIYVRNPYFDEMSFRLNNRTVEVDSHAMEQKSTQGRLFSGGLKVYDPKYDYDYSRYKQMGEEIVDLLLHSERLMSKESVTNTVWAGADITIQQKEVDTKIETEQKSESVPVKKEMECPYCGAVTIPDEKGCCDYCGGNMLE